MSQKPPGRPSSSASRDARAPVNEGRGFFGWLSIVGSLVCIVGAIAFVQQMSCTCPQRPKNPVAPRQGDGAGRGFFGWLSILGGLACIAGALAYASQLGCTCHSRRQWQLPSLDPSRLRCFQGGVSKKCWIEEVLDNLRKTLEKNCPEK